MIVWIDLETTGLDPDVHSIIEVACVITDNKFNEVSRCDALVMNYNSMIPLVEWDYFAREMHESSGLYDDWIVNAINIRNAETTIVGMIHDACLIGDSKPYLGGQSVHFDRSFLKTQMSAVEELLSHRHIDVTSIKRFCAGIQAGVRSDQLPPLKDQTTHRAMDDILASIEAARWYTRNVIWKNPI